jgi:hypothetical protein
MPWGERGYHPSGGRDATPPIDWLNPPARGLQAAAPLIFGAALPAWGLHAIWLAAAVGLLATIALLVLRWT